MNIDCNHKKVCKLFGYGLSEIKWSNVVFLLSVHILAVYGFFHGLTTDVTLGTVIFVSVLSIFSGLGMSVGGHRLWAHKSFKARFPLKLLLLILQTTTLNGSALAYARDHRTHHKWTDQEQDPKNPKLICLTNRLIKMNIDCNHKKVCKLFGYGLSEIKWSNVVFLLSVHILAVYGFYHGLTTDVTLGTVLFVSVLSIFSGLGMSVGGHRLWAHKSFKALFPLKLLLLILQTTTLNGSALAYARDHRTHHKWTDQEQDPKNP
ncbi:unnamed protein product, partial [Medioppia subpectinata]